jgi:hypothetical protein
MLGRNIDFFAVLVIALAMLGFAQLRSWHFPDTFDSIHFGDAIQIERCPLSSQVLSNLASILR